MSRSGGCLLWLVGGSDVHLLAAPFALILNRGQKMSSIAGSFQRFLTLGGVLPVPCCLVVKSDGSLVVVVVVMREGWEW